MTGGGTGLPDVNLDDEEARAWRKPIGYRNVAFWPRVLQPCA